MEFTTDRVAHTILSFIWISEQNFQSLKKFVLGSSFQEKSLKKDFPGQKNSWGSSLDTTGCWQLTSSFGSEELCVTVAGMRRNCVMTNHPRVVSVPEIPFLVTYRPGNFLCHLFVQLFRGSSLAIWKQIVASKLWREYLIVAVGSVPENCKLALWD